MGNAVAITLALEGACGHLKLADFDHLDLSNMNRVRASVSDIGLPKTVLIARQIYEMNPYANLSLFHQGVTPENMDDFLLGEPKLNLLIEECDDLRLKILLRERAKSLRLPVLMETSDRGMVDVERFDLEPDRPLLHGLLGDITSRDLPSDMSDEEKVEFILPFVGTDTISTRAATSMIEIKKTISTWPQLGSEVILGGSSLTVAVRRLALGQPLPSGRRYIDIPAILTSEEPPINSQPIAISSRQFPPNMDKRLPEFIRFVVEHGMLAPSGGNCQPWRFYFDDKKLWVVHDTERSQNLLDLTHRPAYIALGAAIENITIAAAHKGYQTQITPFPNADVSIAAALTFDRTHAVSDELFPHIAKRVTNRTISSRVQLKAEQITDLNGAVETYNCHLHLLTTDAELTEISHIIGEGDRIRFLCSDLHQELMAELRWTKEEAQQKRDGIDIATLELTPAQSAALTLIARPDVAATLREISGGQALTETSHKAIQSASAVGLVTVDGHHPADILRGGRAIERLWLKATAQGLALHPMTAVIYMFDLLNTEDSIFTTSERHNLLAMETKFNQLFPHAHHQPRLILFRLSQSSPPTARSLRLLVEQVLCFGKPPKT